MRSVGYAQDRSRASHVRMPGRAPVGRRRLSEDGRRGARWGRMADVLSGGGIPLSRPVGVWCPMVPPGICFPSNRPPTDAHPEGSQGEHFDYGHASTTAGLSRHRQDGKTSAPPPRISLMSKRRGLPGPRRTGGEAEGAALRPQPRAHLPDGGRPPPDAAGRRNGPPRDRHLGTLPREKEVQPVPRRLHPHRGDLHDRRTHEGALKTPWLDPGGRDRQHARDRGAPGEV